MKHFLRLSYCVCVCVDYVCWMDVCSLLSLGGWAFVHAH